MFSAKRINPVPKHFQLDEDVHFLPNIFLPENRSLEKTPAKRCPVKDGMQLTYILPS